VNAGKFWPIKFQTRPSANGLAKIALRIARQKKKNGRKKAQKSQKKKISEDSLTGDQNLFFCAFLRLLCFTGFRN